MDYLFIFRFAPLFAFLFCLFLAGCKYLGYYRGTYLSCFELLFVVFFAYGLGFFIFLLTRVFE